MELIRVALSKVELNLQLWHMDEDVAEASCALLVSLCDLAPCRARLAELDVWWRLVHAFGASCDVMVALPRAPSRALTYSVCRGCVGGPRWGEVSGAIVRHATSFV